MDGDGDGVKDRYDPADAIPGNGESAATERCSRRLAVPSSPTTTLRGTSMRCGRARAAAGPDASTASVVAVADVASTAACAGAATGPADLATAVRLTTPAAYRALRAAAPLSPWTRASTTTWVLQRYGLRVSAARELGHHTHGDGTAVDLVPTVVATQRDWDASAGRLANDLGWMPSCGNSGVRPACALKPAIQFVGYDGYPSHGSPRTCTGGCPAHIHVSWVSGCYGSSALVAPCGWVMAFPVPDDSGQADR